MSRFFEGQVLTTPPPTVGPGAVELFQIVSPEDYREASSVGFRLETVACIRLVGRASMHVSTNPGATGTPLPPMGVAISGPVIFVEGEEDAENIFTADPDDLVPTSIGFTQRVNRIAKHWGFADYTLGDFGGINDPVGRMFGHAHPVHDEDQPGPGWFKWDIRLPIRLKGDEAIFFGFSWFMIQGTFEGQIAVTNLWSRALLVESS